ncbi:putative membrane protein [Carnobacterium maltaromaticum LMA28]|uniref:Membrane protein n=1 Tax=Carnobacterium maltaromaticum LMA28 TaxID=1234679 RepID=K8EIE9_CARML|nr:putative membrane protein [Carnobacterium maltaromaticum LMA28]
MFIIFFFIQLICYFWQFFDFYGLVLLYKSKMRYDGTK